MQEHTLPLVSFLLSLHYCERVPQALSFLNLTFVKSRGQLFCRMSFNLDFSNISSWLDLDYVFGTWIWQKRGGIFLMTLYQEMHGINLLQYSKFDNVVKVASAYKRFSTIKFHFPPLFLGNVGDIYFDFMQLFYPSFNFYPLV